MSRLKSRTPITQATAPAPEPLQDSKQANDKQPVLASWRDIPPVALAMLTEAWLNWKCGRGVIPKAVNLNDYDYDLALVMRQVPEVTISKRCSSILRSSLQLRQAKLKGEIEKAKADYELNISFIRQMDAVKAEYQAQLQTKTDPDRLNELANHLNGWEEREIELQANADKIQVVILEKGIELDELLNVNLNSVEQWFFKLDEIY
jgi:hypothetical protein